MEVISIDGVDYEKVTTLAKRFKYTTDYIGQLCRAGKVQAKLIGRTWYVHEPSLQNHKKVRYKKTSPDDKNSFESNKIKISRLDVPPVLAKTTAKVIETKVEQSKNFERHVAWKPVRYEEDDSALLPELSGARIKEPVSLPVDLADAVDVPVSKMGAATTTLEPIALPAVALHGSVSVTSVDSYFDNSEENIVIPDELAGTETDTKHTQSHVLFREAQSMPKKQRNLMVRDTQSAFLDAGITKPVTVEQIRPVSVTRTAAVADTKRDVGEQVAPAPLPWFGLFVLTSGSVLVLLLVAMIELHSVSDSVVFTSKLAWSDQVELVRIWQEVINIF